MLTIKQAAPLCDLAHTLGVKEVEYVGEFPWADDLNAQSRVVVMCNHGPLLGPAAIFPTLVSKLNQTGLGALSYAMIVHSTAQSIIGAKRFFGLPKNPKDISFDYYLNLFKKHNLNVLIVAPEGDNATFGDGVNVEPFRSPRSIEIALKTDAKIIIYTALGTNTWQKLINIESAKRKKTLKKWLLRLPGVHSLDEQHLQQTPWFSLPWMSKRIPKLYVQAKYYTPRLTLEELATEPVTRRKQLREEAGHIRCEMQTMLDELKRIKQKDDTNR